MYDIAIIGAGVCGAAIARELSRYRLKICALERVTDVREGTSNAFSAIVHGGFDAPIGSLKALLNVRGNRMMDKMAKELDFPFTRNGSFVVCQRKEELPALEELLSRGETNGVDGMRILSREEALAMEPQLADTVFAALYVPSGGIVCPFTMNIAYAENAAANGVEFFFDTPVISINKE